MDVVYNGTCLTIASDQRILFMCSLVQDRVSIFRKIYRIYRKKYILNV
jgi:hypothetical protein